MIEFTIANKKWHPMAKQPMCSQNQSTCAHEVINFIDIVNWIIFIWNDIIKGHSAVDYYW